MHILEFVFPYSIFMRYPKNTHTQTWLLSEQMVLDETVSGLLAKWPKDWIWKPNQICVQCKQSQFAYIRCLWKTVTLQNTNMCMCFIKLCNVNTHTPISKCDSLSDEFSFSLCCFQSQKLISDCSAKSQQLISRSQWDTRAPRLMFPSFPHTPLSSWKAAVLCY